MSAPASHDIYGKRIFCFWTGDNPIPPVRSDGVQSLRDQSGCEIELITAQNLPEWVQNKDLHPAYPYLNLAHRADFLRIYFMHHFGGGYSDIKPCQNSWAPAFDQLSEDPSLWAMGYREVGQSAVSNLYSTSVDLGDPLWKSGLAWLNRKYLQRRYEQLIGCCAFICKPDTPFTEQWLQETNRRLDALLPALEKSPARDPRDRPE